MRPRRRARREEAQHSLGENLPEILVSPMSQPAHPEAESANTCKYPFALEAVHAVDEEEAAFLYDEIVVRRVYCQHGLSVPPGGTIVDVGANIGLFSVLAAADGARAVFAFEPIPPLVASLARNADALATPGVIRVIPCGLGSADSPAEAFHYFPHSPGESTRHCDQRERNSAVLAAESKLCGFTPPHQTEASPSVYSCPVMTLSTALDAFAIERVDLLKIDVEGDELAVLRGIEARHWPTIAQLVIEVCEGMETRATLSP